MRRMSFAMTKAQLLDGSKTVTRRMGWNGLKPGQRLLAVEKCMGLKKGEHQVVLGTIEVVSVSREHLEFITGDEVDREGFPGMSTDDFIGMFCKAMKCKRWDDVTRIEFRRVEHEPA